MSLLYVCSFFSPLGMAPVVGLVGLGLFQRGFPVVGSLGGMYCNLWFTSWIMLPLKYGILLPNFDYKSILKILKFIKIAHLLPHL